MFVHTFVRRGIGTRFGAKEKDLDVGHYDTLRYLCLSLALTLTLYLLSYR